MENVIIVIIYLKKERVMIMSKSIFAGLTNEILKDLGYKMLIVEFNDDLIANVKYTPIAKEGYTKTLLYPDWETEG